MKIPGQMAWVVVQSVWLSEMVIQKVGQRLGKLAPAWVVQWVLPLVVKWAPLCAMVSTSDLAC